MTAKEKAIVKILKTLKINKETVVGIMLTIKKHNAEDIFLEYLKSIKPETIIENDIMKKVENICLRNRW